MIRTLTLASILAASSLCAAAQPKAKYQNTKLDLGNVAWHTTSEATIKLTNSGNKPLEITDVHPDCECTVVSYDKNPIAPGKSTTIVANYDAEALGHFARMISITTNASAEPTDILLTGQVLTVVDNTSGKAKGKSKEDKKKTAVAEPVVPPTSTPEPVIEAPAEQEQSAVESEAVEVKAPLAVIPAVFRLSKGVGKKQKGTLTLENQGTADLHVVALQVNNPGIEVSLSQAVVKPGGKATLKVNAVSKVNVANGRPRITMTTDDPKHTNIEIDLIVQ